MDATANRFSYRYRTHRRIGSGGMGMVMEATDLLTHQRVALKRILVQQEAIQFASRSQTSNLQLALAREFQTLASLRHPNIISVLDYGFDDNRQPFYTMELLTESDDLISAAAGKDTAGKVYLLIDLLQALLYLHRHGIVHRDLKPANVLVDAQHRVRVLDFGLSQQQGDVDSLAGTLGYIAPELLLEDDLTPAADLYAVGVIAYELFEQQHPFAPVNDSQLIVRVLYELPTPFQSDVPLAIQDIIQRLLSKDPADRYSSADAAIGALSAAIGETIPPETSAQRESFIQAARFVGRDDERRELIHALDAIRQPDAKREVWLIGGESGIGKSRLVDEIRIQALVKGVSVLTGQALEGTQPPFHLWHAIVRELILMTPHQPEDIRIFQAVFGDIESLTDQPIPPLPDNIDIQRWFVMYLGILLDRQTKPLLIVLEDLQWAQDGLLLLEALLQRPLINILIVGTYRNDEMPDLPDRLPPANLMLLDRFSSDEIADLTTSILGETGKKPQVVDMLTEETQGNVFFIVEVIRALADSAGRLSQIGTITLDQQIFTSGMRRIIQRRLSRVPDAYHSLLDTAALYGRMIDTAVLESVHGTPVDEFLYACEAAAVLDVRDNTWRFAHDKLREELLRLLPDDDKPDLHRQLAIAIEATTDDPASKAFQLAHHWREANIPARESRYVIQAAQIAFASNFFREAWDWMQRADTIDVWQYVDATPQQKALFLRQAGSAAYQTGNYEIAIAKHEAARDVALAAGDPATLANILGSLGDICALIGRLDDAERYLDQALDYAQQSADDERIGVILMNRGAMEARRDRIDVAMELIEQSYHHLRRTTNEIEIAKALNNMVISSILKDDYDAALDYNRQAMTIGQRLNNKLSILSSLKSIAELYINHLDDARLAAESLADARRIADELALHKESILLDNLEAEFAEKHNRIDDARQHLTTSIHRARQVNNPMLLAEQYFNRGSFEYRQANLPAAAQDLRIALQLRIDNDHINMQDKLIAYSARVLHAAGQSQAALVALHYARQIHSLDRWDDLSDLYDTLQTTLPHDQRRDAMATGATSSRSEITRRLLDEWLSEIIDPQQD